MPIVETDIPKPSRPGPAPFPDAETEPSVQASLDWAADLPLPSRRRGWRRIAVGVAIAVILGAGALGVRAWTRPADKTDIEIFTVARRTFPVTLSSKGELKAAKSIDIKCELEGQSTIIFLIDEGTQAKKGDLLVELASDEIDEKLRDAEITVANARAAHEASVKEYEILKDENASKTRKAQLALEMAQIGLQKYEEGDRVELEQDAKLALERARSVLKRREDYLKDSEDLFTQGYITRIELENHKFDAYEAQIELKKAELALEVLNTYTIPMDLRQKRSDVDEAKKELERESKAALASEAKAAADVSSKKSELDLVEEKLAKLKEQKAKAKVLAPADGMVVYSREDHWWRSEGGVEVGAQVHERESLIELPDTSGMKVVLRVHEAQVEHLETGLPVTVQIEGFTGRQFTGKVSKIGVLADSQNRWLNPNLKEYETEILLDGSFTELKPGVTAHAEIQLAQLANVITVPVQAVFAKGDKFYVFVADGGETKPVEVKIGMSSNEFVEIRSGLEEGQQVRLAVADAVKRMLPDAPEGAGGPREPKSPTSAKAKRPPKGA